MLRTTRGEELDKQSSRLYYSHDVVSAILSGKYLACERGKVATVTPASATSKQSLEKGDNSGEAVW